MTSIAIREPHNTNQIIISNISIHQDAQGRYSLNDLHQASGGEQRHRPKYWLELQQTNELIEEILKGGIPPFKNEISNSANLENWKPVISKPGRYGGTYVCKELVYAYAMWISAAFALKVIRAYDALITGQVDIQTKPRKQPKQIAGRITADQQEAIKQLVLNRGKALPKENQAKAMITMWSALKSHFGCTYKEIDSEQFTEALSLAARVPLEGEYIGKEEPSLDTNVLPDNGKVLVVIRDRKIQDYQTVDPNSHVLTLNTFMELAQKAGYLIIHKESFSKIVNQW